MQDTETPDTSTGLVRRPYAQSMMVFRDAVYADPGLVSISIPGLDGEEPSILWVSDMHPGDVIRVIGMHAGRVWRAVLICEPGEKFSVKPAGPEPPAPGEPEERQPAA